MLSDRQVEVFDCIRNFIAVANYAPTYGELQMLLGMKTKSHVHYHLLRLREAGLITWRPGRVRSIRMVGDGCPITTLGHDGGGDE